MGVVKQLYLGSSLSDLQSKAKLGDTSKWNIKALCTSSEKVFKEAVHQKNLGDEEKAYTFFFKYLECVQKVRKNKDYSKDEKYYTSMYNISKNSRNAIEALESLADSLDTRYEERNLSKKISTLDKELLDKDVILDENSNKDPNLVNGVVDDSPKNEYLITAKKLYSLINEKSTTFFIFDTRSEQDFKFSSIKLPNSLNIPETILLPGTTAVSVGKKLHIQYRDQWERRSKVDMLIICDWTSTSFISNTPPEVLRSALTNWDIGTTYPQLPYLLEGGFQKFLFAYPHHVTNPKARAPKEPSNNKTTETLLPRLDIDYPDLDDGFLTTPSPSPKGIPSALMSGAIKISRGGPISSISTASSSVNSSYPSLSDLNSFQSISSPKPDTPSVSNTPRTVKRPFIPPSIPDRRSKPTVKDELSDTKLSTDSESIGSSFSSSRSSSSYSRLNQAIIDLDNSDGSVSNQSLPKVNRSLKKDALVKYGENVENIEDVIKVENGIAEMSLEREKERLDMENRWEKLRSKREAEAEVTMKEMILVEQDKLVEELERLKIKDRENEENEKKLVEELELIKENLKREEDEKNKYIEQDARRKQELDKIEVFRKAERGRQEEISRKEREKQAVLEEVEKKRNERRKQERRRKDEDKRILERKNLHETRNSPLSHNLGEVKPKQDETNVTKKEKLKTESDAPKSGLKRSLSSPNIAKMLENEASGGFGWSEGASGYSGVPIPKFDRKQKPSLITNRNFAGVWGTQKPGLTGLKNLGNTCYMNSILQCVSNTPPLAHYLISRSYEEDLNSKHSETRGHVATEFAEVLKNLWSSQFKSISPSDFKQMVGRYKLEFAGRDQQDSHEFCSKLLEWLHGDTNRVIKPSKEPEQNWKDSNDRSAAVTHWRNYLERNQSIIVQLFVGQTRSVLRCLNCGGESVTYREFTNLTLPLPNTSARVSLKECFDEYLREEIIDEVTCESCKKSGKATKKTDIVKLPPLLVIHLSRFYQDGMYTRKKQNFVNFDLKNLNIGQYAVPGLDNKYNSFSLYAVSNHFGSLEGGHYTAYCSSNVLKRWHKYDDQDVSPMDSDKVVSSAAYILFYSAIEGQTSLSPLG